MPGVLIVEAMAQAGGLCCSPKSPTGTSKLMVFTGIERAKFRRPVVPGDQLRIEIDVLNWQPRAVRMQGLHRRQAGLRGHRHVRSRSAKAEGSSPEAAPAAAAVDEPAAGAGDSRVSIHPTAIVASSAIVSESCT